MSLLLLFHGIGYLIPTPSGGMLPPFVGRITAGPYGSHVAFMVRRAGGKMSMVAGTRGRATMYTIKQGRLTMEEE